VPARKIIIKILIGGTIQPVPAWKNGHLTDDDDDDDDDYLFYLLLVVVTMATSNQPCIDICSKYK